MSTSILATKLYIPSPRPKVVFRSRLASVWYEQNGLPSDAIRHALTAEDFERAADLIELAGPIVEESSQTARWLGWIRALPDGLIRARPVLSVWYAYVFGFRISETARDAKIKETSIVQ